MKTCVKCKKNKTEDDFHRCASSYDGLKSRCKDCRSDDHREPKVGKRVHGLTIVSQYDMTGICTMCGPVKIRRTEIRPKVKYRCINAVLNKRSPNHGARVSDVRLARVGKSCAICGSDGAMVLDHDHATGELRGFLCNPCNGALGMMRDNISRLESAIAYLSDPPGVDFANA